jgi:uncharacterized delta-60 repeat protein
MKINVNKFFWSARLGMLRQLLVVGMAAAALWACGPGLASLGPFTIGGTVTGLTGTVVLQNNGGDNVSLTADGSFTFAKQLAKDAAYLVTVLTPPTGQVCTVSSGAGTATEKVTTVSVSCIAPWTGTKQPPRAAGVVSVGQSVTVDASGNVYVAGDASGGLDGNMPFGGNDAFFVKYNISGVKQYTQQLGDVGARTNGQSVATDKSGNVYVAGFTDGSLSSDPKVGNNQDFFVTKYNSNGARVYTRQLGVTGLNTYGYSVTVDSSGNVYVAGATNGGLDGISPRGVADFFVAKYNSDLAWQYTKQLGVAGAETLGHSVTVDSSGNVYVAGSTTGALDGSAPRGSTDFFVTKYNNAGVLQYTKQLGVADKDTFGYSVAVDSSGNVYVAGYTAGALNGSTPRGLADYFVAKYDSAGVWQSTWQRGGVEATASSIGHSVAVDSSGNVYVAGETTAQLYGDLMTGTKDLFIAKYNSKGDVLYLHQSGIAGKDTVGQSVALDASGNVYVAGSADGGLDGNVLTTGLSYFVSKYDVNGIKQ